MRDPLGASPCLYDLQFSAVCDMFTLFLAQTQADVRFHSSL
jgi:hypothetical protein